jgi:RNase P protein component
MGEAELRGIDVEKLQGERFSHPSHYRMLREHADRVREFELHQSFDRYFELKVQAAAQALVDAEAVEQAVKRNRKKRVVKKYEFTDEQLAIAERSLGR